MRRSLHFGLKGMDSTYIFNMTACNLLIMDGEKIMYTIKLAMVISSGVNSVHLQMFKMN